MAKNESTTKLSRVQKAFLAAFEQCGQVSLSARCCRISRTMHYEWMHEPAPRGDLYREAFEESQAIACESLEAEARRRAVDGVNEPVIYKGEMAGIWINKRGERVAAETRGAKFVPLTVKKYSDMLLMAMLNANLPDKYRPRKDEPPKGDPLPPPEQIEKEILDFLGEDNGDADGT